MTDVPFGDACESSGSANRVGNLYTAEQTVRGLTKYVKD